MVMAVKRGRARGAWTVVGVEYPRKRAPNGLPKKVVHVRCRCGRARSIWAVAFHTLSVMGCEQCRLDDRERRGAYLATELDDDYRRSFNEAVSDYGAMTLNQIGEVYSISRERVRQIEVQALKHFASRWRLAYGTEPPDFGEVFHPGGGWNVDEAAV